MNEFLKHVPTPTAGLALGLVSLGGLLGGYATAFTWAGAVLAASLIALLVAKAIFQPAALREDLKNPIFASVSGTFFMTIMQLAALFPSTLIAFAVWITAVAGHLALIGWFSTTFVRHFRLDQIFPTYFIAYVGIIVASVTSPAFGMQALGEALFWLGLAFYAVLLALVTYRMLKVAVPTPAKPLVCIYAAPMSLSLTGYLTCFDAPFAPAVAALAVLAQALLVVVLFQLPGLFKLLHESFYPSVAAMTFPFVITATGLGKAAAFFAAQGVVLPDFIGALTTGETILAAVMVGYALVRYAGYFGALLSVDDSPALTMANAA